VYKGYIWKRFVTSDAVLSVTGARVQRLIDIKGEWMIGMSSETYIHPSPSLKQVFWEICSSSPMTKYGRHILCYIVSLSIFLRDICSGEVWRHDSLDTLVDSWLNILTSGSYSKVISTDNITLSDVHFSRVTELWIVAVMPVGIWWCRNCRIPDHQVFCSIFHRLQRVDHLSGDIFNFCKMNHHIC